MKALCDIFSMLVMPKMSKIKSFLPIAAINSNTLIFKTMFGTQPLKKTFKRSEAKKCK